MDCAPPLRGGNLARFLEALLAFQGYFLRWCAHREPQPPRNGGELSAPAIRTLGAGRYFDDQPSWVFGFTLLAPAILRAVTLRVFWLSLPPRAADFSFTRLTGNVGPSLLQLPNHRMGEKPITR